MKSVSSREVGNHLLDLARRAQWRSCVELSDFLTLAEQTEGIRTLRSEGYHCFLAYGGYDDAERCRFLFYPDWMEEDTAKESSEIVALSIVPKSLRFAEALTHRDYLGALMNLGVERRVLGDILVSESGALCFCVRELADYLCDTLHMVKHTTVLCSRETHIPEEFKKTWHYMEATVASPRMDSVVAAAFRTSRSSLKDKFSAGEVFCNGEAENRCEREVKEGDIVSVRGKGKFRYRGVLRTTKKERCVIALEIAQ